MINSDDYARPLSELLFPARDTSFGSIIESLSEATNAPRGDNFVSNEDSYPRVVGQLEKRVTRDGVYLGVGPDQNFTLIAATHPSLALIVDFRRRNLLVHLLQRALISLSKDRVSYLARLTARQPARVVDNPNASELVNTFKGSKYSRTQLLETRTEIKRMLEPLNVVREQEWAELYQIQERVAGPGLDVRFLALPGYPTLGQMIQTTDRDNHPAHWLSTEDRYQVVHALQRNDRVVPIVADVVSAPAFTKLAAFLRGNRLEVSCVYASDVEFFLLRAGKLKSYAENLGRLPLRKTCVIVRTSTRPIVHPARVTGDHSTTVIDDLPRYLDRVRDSKVTTLDDLFTTASPESPDPR